MTRKPNRRIRAEEADATYMDSASFARASFDSDWLVQDILLERQPAVIGGPMKCLKTSIAIDLAISLASGRPFLGFFQVPRQVPVAFLSAESSAATLQESARRICRAKGTTLDDCDALWRLNIPALGHLQTRKQLAEGLASRQIEVVIIDPLYLCLLPDSTGIEAKNLYEIGHLLYGWAQACLGVGVTPILVHHTTKTAARNGREPLSLEDLAFSGIGEFVRQWLLLQRREPYQAGSGCHHLTMATGGSAGHSSIWELNVHEGVFVSTRHLRQWNVAVCQQDKRGATRRPPTPASARRNMP